MLVRHTPRSERAGWNGAYSGVASRASRVETATRSASPIKPHHEKERRDARLAQRVTGDAALIGLHTEAPGLKIESVRQEPLAVALPAHHRLARKRGIGLRELEGDPFFWFERRLNPGFYDYCQAYFDRIGFAPTVVPEPPDHHVLLGLIAAGQGLALVPASLRSIKRRGVAFRALKEGNELSMGVALVYAEGHSSEALEAFIGCVRAQARRN